MTVNHLMLFLHVLGFTLWVGGTAFAWACLRPVAGNLAQAPRLELWCAVLARFFPLVWASITVVACTGGYRLFQTGFSSAPRAWHAMLLTGGLMIAVFLSIWFGPWQRLRSAVRAEDWTAASLALSRICERMGFSLALGVLTIAVSTLGLGIRA